MNKGITSEFIEKWAERINQELEWAEHICNYTITDCLYEMFRELGMWTLDKSGQE
jgi:hypothetical protein